jgi:hypothetical protein
MSISWRALGSHNILLAEVNLGVGTSPWEIFHREDEVGAVARGANFTLARLGCITC